MSEKVFHPELNRLINLALGEKVYDEGDDEGEDIMEKIDVALHEWNKNYIMEEGNDE